MDQDRRDGERAQMRRSGAAAALVGVRLGVLGGWRASQAACRRQNARLKMQDTGREWPLQKWAQSCLSGLADCEGQPWRRDLRQANQVAAPVRPRSAQASISNPSVKSQIVSQKRRRGCCLV